MCSSLLTEAANYSFTGAPPAEDDIDGEFNRESSIAPLLSVVSYSLFTGLVPHLAMERPFSRRFIDLFNKSPTFPFVTNILLRGSEINLDYIKQLIIGDDPSVPRIRFVKKFVLMHATLCPEIGDFIANSLPALEWYRIWDVDEDLDQCWENQMWGFDALAINEVAGRASPVVHVEIYVRAFQNPNENIKSITAWKVGRLLNAYDKSPDKISSREAQEKSMSLIPHLFAVLDSSASVIKKESTFENCLWCFRHIILKNIHFNTFAQTQSSRNAEMKPDENVDQKRFATLRHFLFARSLDLKIQTLWVVSDLLEKRPLLIDAAIEHDLIGPIINLLKFESVAPPDTNNNNTFSSRDERKVDDYEMKKKQQEVWFAAARVLGDFTDDVEHSAQLIEWNLLECFESRLDPSNPDNTSKIRKELCWMASNLVTDETAATLIFERHPHMVKYIIENLKEETAPLVAKEAAYFVANSIHVAQHQAQNPFTPRVLEFGALEGLLHFHKTCSSRSLPTQVMSHCVIQSFETLHQMIDWDHQTCAEFFCQVFFAVALRREMLRKEVSALEKTVLEMERKTRSTTNNSSSSSSMEMSATIEKITTSTKENCKHIELQLEALRAEKQQLRENIEKCLQSHDTVGHLVSEARSREMDRNISTLESLHHVFTHQVLRMTSDVTASSSSSLLSLSTTSLSANFIINNAAGDLDIVSTSRIPAENITAQWQQHFEGHDHNYVTRSLEFRNFQRDVKALTIKKMQLQSILMTINDNDQQQSKLGGTEQFDEMNLLDVKDDPMGEFVEFEDEIWFYPTKSGHERYQKESVSVLRSHLNVITLHSSIEEKLYIFDRLPSRCQLLHFIETEITPQDATKQKDDEELEDDDDDEEENDDDEDDDDDDEDDENDERAVAFKTFCESTERLLSQGRVGLYSPSLHHRVEDLITMEKFDLFRLGKFVYSRQTN